MNLPYVAPELIARASARRHIRRRASDKWFSLCVLLACGILMLGLGLLIVGYKAGHQDGYRQGLEAGR